MLLRVIEDEIIFEAERSRIATALDGFAALYREGNSLSEEFGH